MPDIYKPSFLYRVTLTVFAVIAICSLALTLIFWVDNTNQQAANCRRGNVLREFIRDDVVKPAYASQGLDLTKVPGFDQAWNPEQAQFFANLAQLSASRPSAEDQIISKINATIREC